MDETQTLALLAFFDGRPEEAAPGPCPAGGILLALPETQVQVQKTQITFEAPPRLCRPSPSPAQPGPEGP